MRANFDVDGKDAKHETKQVVTGAKRIKPGSAAWSAS